MLAAIPGSENGAAAPADEYIDVREAPDHSADIHDRRQTDFVKQRRSLYMFNERTAHLTGAAYQRAVIDLFNRNPVTEKAIEAAVALLNVAKAMPFDEFKKAFVKLLVDLRSRAGSPGENLWREQPHIFTITPSLGDYHTIALEKLGALAEKAQYADGQFLLSKEERVQIFRYSYADFTGSTITVDPLLKAYREMGVKKGSHYLVISQQLHTSAGFKEVAKRVVELSKKEMGNLKKTFEADHVRPMNVTVVSPCKTKAWKPASAHIDFWLNEMALLCQQALRWETDSFDKELEDIVAKLRYIFVLTAPFGEENEIIGEWLELAIYVALGFDSVRHKDEKYGVYDALAKTCTGFCGRYRETVALGRNRYRES